MKCIVPQGSDLKTLLILLYANDLNNETFVLDPTIFRDDADLIFTHSDIQKLFSTMNKKLASISQWFASNKLSLNVKKKKKKIISLMLSKLTINNHLTGSQKFINFLGVLQDKLERSHQINREQNYKNLELLYNATLFFGSSVLYVYTYLHQL